MEKLHQWFFENKREFPWRIHPTPYHVWVSEVMLQQTRASVVIPYFNRWMEAFPDIQSLASAPVEEAIKLWEGLGYYSRVRNLHAAAGQVVREFGGQIPDTHEKLSQLKGLGSYTIGAILSFGFHKRAAAVDGNVLRVLSRYFCIEENVCRSQVKRSIESRAEELLDKNEPWVTAEALIELGATICNRIPRCDDCPLRGSCVGFQSCKAEYLPIKTPPPKITILERVVIILYAEGKVLLKKGGAGQVMADLYEFPYFIKGEKSPWPLDFKKAIRLSSVQHTFTRYKATLYPRLFSWEISSSFPEYIWVEKEKLSQFPFSSGHKKIVQELCKFYI